MASKNKLGPIALVLACGTSLFSDGYLNGVLGSARTFLKRQYGAGKYHPMLSAYRQKPLTGEIEVQSSLGSVSSVFSSVRLALDSWLIGSDDETRCSSPI